MNVQALINDIKRDEGFRSTAYIDTRGLLTIGYGRLVDQGGGITHDEADYLLANDLSKVINQMDSNFPWLKNMSDTRQRAIANMAFQLGISGLLKFHDMLASMENGNFNDAATEALDSVWARQTPQRAMRISEMIRLGDNYQP